MTGDEDRDEVRSSFAPPVPPDSFSLEIKPGEVSTSGSVTTRKYAVQWLVSRGGSQPVPAGAEALAPLKRMFSDVLANFSKSLGPKAPPGEDVAGA